MPVSSLRSRQGLDATGCYSGTILVALLWFCYAWRQTYPERALRRRSKFTRVDRMERSRQFEKYCIGLLQAHGYRIADWTGRTGNDQGVDIIVISARGVVVAVQCKRQKDKVGPDVIRELIGATASGPYKGLAGMVMTSAFVTDGARECARRRRIKVVDRPELRELDRCRVRLRLDPRRARRTNLITLVTLIMAGALCSAAVSMSIVMHLVATHPHSTAPAPDSSSAPARSSPRAVLDQVRWSGSISRPSAGGTGRKCGASGERMSDAAHPEPPRGWFPATDVPARDIVLSLGVTQKVGLRPDPRL